MFLRFVNHRFYDVDGAGGGAPASAPAGGAPQGAAPVSYTHLGIAGSVQGHCRV